jgi:phosphate transport system protein
MQKHISTAFDQDLQDLDQMVISLGGLAQSQLQGIASAIRKIDTDSINSLIANDKKLDEIDAEIFSKVVEIIALRSPRAEDLRKVLVSPKISASFERIGDYSRNAGKRLNTIAETTKKIPYADDILEIAEHALTMVVDVNDAYARDDADKAIAVWESDVQLDMAYNQCITHIANGMNDGSCEATLGMNCIFIAKNMERIGDHTTGIAEQIYFRINGEMPDDDRPKEGDAGG